MSQSGWGYGEDRLISRDCAAPRFDTQARCAVVDARDRTVKYDWKPGAMRGDSRAEALDHAPVLAAILVAHEIVRRNVGEFGPADERIDGDDQVVPAVAGLQECRGGLVRHPLRLVEPLVERVACLQIFALFLDRESDRRGLTHPRRRR